MRPGSIRTVMTALFTVGLLASSPILSATTAGAQQLQVPTGTVAGRVVDQKDGQPLSDVVVQLVGTARTVQTGVDGRFRLPDVPAGTVTIFARRIGFQPKTVTGLYLDGGRTLEQPIALEEASLQLTAVVVSADKERGTVSAAIDAQRNAVGIVSAIGSEQISRSPDADASQAIQRLSGVTLADAKFVSVRGLDPRYTTASLNGARLASPEPERKVVPLDLFPAGLLQSVSATKTFAPD